MIKRYSIYNSYQCGEFKSEVNAHEDLKKIIEHHNEQEKK